MQRRELLKAASATIGGAAMLAAGAPAMAAEHKRPKKASSLQVSGAYVQTRDGTQLFRRDWGAGAPLVFLSGWALPSDFWSYQMAPLSERNLRCISYDRRGHGRSDDPGRGYDYDTLADDLADVLEALDLDEVTLVAHSMAGGEAVRYLTRHGSKRVARLALVGTTLPFMTKTADNEAGIDPTVFERARNNALLKDFPKALHDGMRPFVLADTSNELIDWVRDMMLRCSMKALVDCNRALTSTDFRAELPKVAVDTLIVHGDRDVSAPLDLTGRRAAALIRNAQVKIYEGAPHGLMLTHVDRFNHDLLEFVGACAQTGAAAGCAAREGSAREGSASSS
jgi:non-heme chloroperoxidase